jgi:hypothetical protein
MMFKSTVAIISCIVFISAMIGESFAQSYNQGQSYYYEQRTYPGGGNYNLPDRVPNPRYDPQARRFNLGAQQTYIRTPQYNVQPYATSQFPISPTMIIQDEATFRYLEKQWDDFLNPWHPRVPIFVRDALSGPYEQWKNAFNEYFRQPQGSQEQRIAGQRVWQAGQNLLYVEKIIQARVASGSIEWRVPEFSPYQQMFQWLPDGPWKPSPYDR